MNFLPQRQVHLDFHTSEAVDGIGSRFDKKQFQSCLKKGHVNSITLFAKCHHGWAYFPSEENEIHPGLHGFDLLSAQIEACREIGVQTPLYISAGFDQKYIVEHPEALVTWHWGETLPETAVNEKGHRYFTDKDGFRLICFNSPYLDVLKKQVEEVVRKFMPVGIFLDIVAPRLCYCKYCKAEVEKLGLDSSDPESYWAISESTYKKYYETVNNAARAIKPDIRIFHNGGHIACGKRDQAHANTHLELESLPTGGWGYDHFPKSAKYVKNLGMDYLGMTGKFHGTWGEFGGFKHPNALKYEIALSLANGAKCSVGDQMHPYGFLDDATYELIGEAFAEAEKVEEYCYDVDVVAQIGILEKEEFVRCDHSGTLSDVGANRIMLEGKYLCENLDTGCDFSKYKLIILPDSIKVTGSLKTKLCEYVKNGGKVLCSGESGTDEKGEFAFDLGVKFVGKSDVKPSYYRPEYKPFGLSSSSFVMYNDKYDVILSGGKVLGHVRDSFFNRAPEHFCSHRHTPYKMEDCAPGVVIGKDGGYIAWEIFAEYAEIGSIVLKDTVIHAIDEILGEDKVLFTNLPSGAVVTFNEQKNDNRFVLHALYAAPVVRGRNTQIIEDLVPLYNSEFEIATEKKIKNVRLVPQNKNVDFTEKDGRVCFKIDEFTCSQLVVLEYLN
ncbi:MAG: alpha-L-fucosidase [Clostridia bacterium]|nr:alpha-L-fucosidase [Clostridia bacterium]